MTHPNQNPEQKARDAIDNQLRQAGWVIQDKNKIDFSAGVGVAVREYTTDVGPADYVLFVDRQAVGVIEAKREEEGQNITVVEEQSGDYAKAKLKWVSNAEPLPYVYESTGIITRFTNGYDPKPRSREIYTFHRPETLKEWLSKPKSLRARLQDMPPLDHEGLRDCQVTAIENLEQSFKDDRPRALVQMATGSGKTFTAITSAYRLLKHADAQRILFLVDTKNLGEQAEQEFLKFVPNDDNRKFTELYNARRLTSPFVPKDSQVCICTIQRMYSILKSEELDEALEELNPAEQLTRPKEPLPVVYNAKVPPEFFDFIIIDECHRSIYNLWRQVLEYFDSSLIGLTATPDNRTYGFFKKNVVSEYDHEKAVADGVNVGNEIYVIETERTAKGGTIKANQNVERREKLTRKKRWEMQDEDETYSATQLDPDTVETKAKDTHKTLEPTEEQKKQAQTELVKGAANMFTGQFIDLIDNIRRDKEQIIDHDNLDKLTHHGWAGDRTENAKEMVQDFETYLTENKDEIEALTIFYDTPHRRQTVTFDMIKSIFEKLRSDKPRLAPVMVWRAYALLDEVKSEQPVNELTALISLIRRACGIDTKISRHSEKVRKNFQDWIMKHHSGSGEKFNKEQMEWLHMIRNHVMTSFHIERDDLELSPFDTNGGLGKMYKLFGEDMDTLINELNEVLAA